MNRPIACLILVAVLPTVSALADDPPPTPLPIRLDQFAISGTKVKPADSDAPLAEGWPKGTEPGRIEVKKYPGYRSAVARGKGAAAGADNVLFFPLFNHISRSEIAMTTPVVSTYSADVARDRKARGDVSMEFVYRSPTMGKTGQGVGAVQVEDHPAAYFVCLGVQGADEPDRLILAVAAVHQWLAEHQNEWVEDGPPRRLGYHGPMTPRDQRLWEVQIPIKAVTKASVESKR